MYVACILHDFSVENGMLMLFRKKHSKDNPGLPGRVFVFLEIACPCFGEYVFVIFMKSGYEKLAQHDSEKNRTSIAPPFWSHFVKTMLNLIS